MTFENFTDLIQSLPVRNQSFTTKRTYKKWLYAENNFPWFKSLNDTIFEAGNILTLSRNDLFEINDPKEKIIKIVYWGYPKGMQGGHENLKGILQEIDNIIKILSELKGLPSISIKNLTNVQKDFEDIDGLGMSTYSKLLYFFQINVDNLPCLIVDQRILRAIRSNLFSDFKAISRLKGKKEKNYFTYLKCINDIAKKLNTKGENIEQFLFLFGNNLKENTPNSLLTSKS